MLFPVNMLQTQLWKIPNHTYKMQTLRLWLTLHSSRRDGRDELEVLWPRPDLCLDLHPKSHPLIAQVQKYKLTNTLAPNLSPPTQTHKTHTGVPLTVRRSGTRRWWMWLSQRCKSEEKLKDSPAKSPNETSTDREGLWWMGLALQVWWKNLQPPDCPHRPNKNLSRERSYINHIGEKVMSRADFQSCKFPIFYIFTSF